MSIALHMIVSGKEPVDGVTRAINSIKDQVDGMYICITSPMEDKTLKTSLEELGCVVDYEPDKFFHTVTKKDINFIKKLGLKPEFEKGEKLFLFDKARNHSMQMVPKRFSWMIWIDADDVFRGKKLKSIVADAEANQLDSVFLNYIYQADFDEKGNVKTVIIEHLRERIIRNNDVYEWVAPIHETLIEKKPTRKKDYWECDVLHMSNMDRKQTAIGRNTKVLQYSIVQKEAKDPRPLYYLAKAYYDLWLIHKDTLYLKQAKLLFESYLNGENPSGWAEERSQCWEYLVEVYRAMGEFNNAIKCGHNAMIEDERFPSIYINMALSYLMKKEWGRALFWVRLATKVEQPNTTLVTTPKDLATRTLEVIYHASLQTNQLDEANAAALKLSELMPESQEMRNRLHLTMSMIEQRELTKHMVALAQHLSKTGQTKKLPPLIQSIPDLIKDNPFMVDLAKKVIPPKVHGKDEITIYCGPAFTQWSPRHLENPGESFVGGSEEAVIYLSQELKKQGWKVTVYADPGEDEGDWDGVNYLPYYKFNTNDEFNVLVGWRRPDLVDQNLNAKKTYIWCHDVQNDLDYTEDRLKKITKVIVLSPAHRENIPSVPDEKVLISSNGITIEEYPDDIEPNPTKIFYGSSYDRGLEHLLRMWKDIKKEVPDATLEVAYGWQLFEKFYKNNPASMKWKEEMDKLMTQDGITHRGRLPQTEIPKAMRECGVWAYPTHFYEISCINAMKAQAIGSIPVVINYAALKDTVKHGIKVDGDIFESETREKYIKELTSLLKDKKRQEEIRVNMTKQAREEFGWNKVSSLWTKEMK